MADDEIFMTSAKGFRYFIVASGAAFTLASEYLVLDGAESGGGIQNEGTFILNGATIQNCYSSSGGGGVYNFRVMEMNGGKISGNIASVVGSGVYNLSSNANDEAFIMNGG